MQSKVTYFMKKHVKEIQTIFCGSGISLKKSVQLNGAKSTFELYLLHAQSHKHIILTLSYIHII